MDLGLSGKNVLVTGSSSGIGAAIAAALIREGCNVAINGRNQNRLQKAVEDLGAAFGFQSDVSCPTGAKTLMQDYFEKFSSLDLLICNVGSGSSVRPGEETYSEWQRVFAQNLWSATNIIESAREHLISSRGSIVCVSSICGNEVIPGAPVTYSVAKSALNSYVKGIAKYFGPLGVRINAVSPGNILFDGSVWERKLNSDQAAVKEMLFREVALNRLGEANEIGDLVAYLCSPVSAFLTGEIVTIDGGQVRS